MCYVPNNWGIWQRFQNCWYDFTIRLSGSTTIPSLLFLSSWFCLFPFYLQIAFRLVISQLVFFECTGWLRALCVEESNNISSIIRSTMTRGVKPSRSSSIISPLNTVRRSLLHLKGLGQTYNGIKLNNNAHRKNRWCY